MRVFLCDDNPEYRVLARVVLQRDGLEVVGEARDADTALREAPAVAPDVLLLDLNMPRMSGHEALPVLRERLPGTRIVVLTSGRAEDERDRVLAAGADGFIHKPESAFSLPGLLRAELAECPGASGR